MTESVRKATARDLGQLAPLFDAYRQFYGQPADLPRAREFLGERLSREESLVLEAAADLSRASGAVELRLSTAITNVAAQRLYEAMGWRRDDEFHEYFLALRCRNEHGREENTA